MTPILVWSKNYFSFVPGFAHKHGGFTLLEVMIAISLLAIALTTLFGSQSQSVSLGSTTKFNIQAPFLAQQKLAEFTRTTDRLASDSGDFGDKFPGYQWKIETEDANLEASQILSKLEDTFQRVTLTVSWGDNHYVYQVQSYLLKNTVR
ncbi:MAG: prepilin-type N-terminal cleavage/methylation domain-containing protein [Desulfocapsaceae bacterium]|jgi:general secretion pathway protein I|nr:prepilin-type N-terminal cleavage/methylation domain-containing protein [Desulfocapsaceae bacterium]